MTAMDMEQTAGAAVHAESLRVRDRVRVRSRDEILATLDSNGALDGLPFMPEMLAFAGSTFRVDAVTHRTCDTVKTSGTSGTTRRLPGAVHLQGVRCDGSAHGGCQAGCLIYWKETWLEPAEPLNGEAAASARDVGDPDVPPLLQASTRGPGDTQAQRVYSCQATKLLGATSFVSARDPRVWIQDVRSRNAALRTAVASIVVHFFNKWQGASRRLPRSLRIRDGRAWPWFFPSGERLAPEALGLRPGDLVEVKSRAEIEQTLDEHGSLRGLRFSAEMLPYCGKHARVLTTVDRIIDEKTGRMLKLRDCIILEDVWCDGRFRALCRRKIYMYWREAWLKRA